jgi:hypothetical protein
VTTGTIAEKILLRTDVLIKDDTNNEKPSKKMCHPGAPAKGLLRLEPVHTEKVKKD